ncbi:hypothetical protein E2562_028113 [Oryza meyeriana var. granulata]|uniref:Uncharacterized protein n=1 Tax=Oryza meyeriana var. granulata TaxID=110450 RepID=A0A6G1C9Q0_9ORYZ|nr:hypothetical protein E2562_028113 [Oryza meyeriana var. granulata]
MTVLARRGGRPVAGSGRSSYWKIEGRGSMSGDEVSSRALLEQLAVGRPRVGGVGGNREVTVLDLPTSCLRRSGDTT